MSAKATILSVDDEPRNLRILDEIFGDKYMHYSARSAEEAILIAKNQHVDVILLDVMLPGLDGYGACREFRKLASCALTKIILVSGKGLLDERLAGYEAGADDYITKPFVAEELEAKVRVFLRLKNLEEQLTELNRTLEERVELRSRQLIASEKMAFIGMNTAQIVHNLNSPLAILKLIVGAFHDDNPEDDRVVKLGNAVEKMEAIVHTILQSAQNSVRRPSGPIYLNEIIESELNLLSSNQLFKYDVKKQFAKGDLPALSGDVSHFSQVVANLLKNALDAMYKSDIKQLSLATEFDGEAVTFKVTDTGCGISEENLGKIFDPFFTTKSSHSDDGVPMGTGLGLASVKQMVEAYSGDILVRSKLGEGTTFEVRFPVEK